MPAPMIPCIRLRRPSSPTNTQECPKQSMRQLPLPTTSCQKLTPCGSLRRKSLRPSMRIISSSSVPSLTPFQLSSAKSFHTRLPLSRTNYLRWRLEVFKSSKCSPWDALAKTKATTHSRTETQCSHKPTKLKAPKAIPTTVLKSLWLSKVTKYFNQTQLVPAHIRQLASF
jgi:hypothetical protein